MNTANGWWWAVNYKQLSESTVSFVDLFVISLYHWAALSALEFKLFRNILQISPNRNSTIHHKGKENKLPQHDRVICSNFKQLFKAAALHGHRTVWLLAVAETWNIRLIWCLSDHRPTATSHTQRQKRKVIVDSFAFKRPMRVSWAFGVWTRQCSSYAYGAMRETL